MTKWERLIDALEKAEVENGVIQSAKVYSDAMDWQLPQQVESLLQGVRFEKDAICEKLQAFHGDIAQWLQQEWESL